MDLRLLVPEIDCTTLFNDPCNDWRKFYFTNGDPNNPVLEVFKQKFAAEWQL